MTKAQVDYMQKRRRAAEIIAQNDETVVNLVTALYEAQVDTFVHDPDVENLTTDEYTKKWEDTYTEVREFICSAYCLDWTVFHQIWWACEVLATERAMEFA